MNSSRTGVARQADRLPAQIAAREGHPDRGGSVRDDESRPVRAEGLAEPRDTFRHGGRGVRVQKRGIAQRDLEVVEPVPDERLERHGVNVVILDSLEDLVIEVGGLILGQGEQDPAKAGVGIAAMQLEMDLAEAEAAAELDAAGPVIEGLAVDLHGPTPVPRPFLVEAAFEDGGGVFGRGRCRRRPTCQRRGGLRLVPRRMQPPIRPARLAR